MTARLLCIRNLKKFTQDRGEISRSYMKGAEDLYLNFKMEVTKCKTYQGLRRRGHNLRQSKIRRNILEQFTFYDIYYDVISQLEDDEAGRFAKRICNYAFNGVDSHGKTENENCFWEIIYPTLNDATAIEKQDKKPYYLNRKMKHFTFYAAYARIELPAATFINCPIDVFCDPNCSPNRKFNERLAAGNVHEIKWSGQR